MDDGHHVLPPEKLVWALGSSFARIHWGGQKLSSYLVQNDICYLSPATLNRIKKQTREILDKKQLTLPVSYEFINPNDAWSLDFLKFKGEKASLSDFTPFGL